MLFIPNGKKLIYHNGWWHGNRTVFVRMLDEDATIIALSNNDYKNIYSAKRLCDLFGDYRQGHESFDEGEPDPADSTGALGGGEPSRLEEKVVVTHTTVHAAAHAHHRHIVHKPVAHSTRRRVPKKKTVQAA
jgi:hypothetical protein